MNIFQGVAIPSTVMAMVIFLNWCAKGTTSSSVSKSGPHTVFFFQNRAISGDFVIQSLSVFHFVTKLKIGDDFVTAPSIAHTIAKIRLL